MCTYVRVSMHACSSTSPEIRTFWIPGGFLLVSVVMFVSVAKAGAIARDDKFNHPLPELI